MDDCSYGAPSITLTLSKSTTTTSVYHAYGQISKWINDIPKIALPADKSSRFYNEMVKAVERAWDDPAVESIRIGIILHAKHSWSIKYNNYSTSSPVVSLTAPVIQLATATLDSPTLATPITLLSTPIAPVLAST